MNHKSFQGAGLSARPLHFSKLLKTPHTSWIEILVDNYLENFPHTKTLEKLSELYALTFHSVNLSLGNVKELDWTFLKKIKNLVKKYKPALISDHLCWTNHKNHYFHDLLPLPYNEETALRISCRIKILQDYFETPLAIENISSYLDFKASTFDEIDFINFIAEKSPCLILLDVNNIYVNSLNRNIDPYSMLKKLSFQKVAQYHVAGFIKTKKGYAIDTHSRDVSLAVWNLFKNAVEIIGPRPCCIEWDQNIPEFEVLLKEVEKIKSFLKSPFKIKKTKPKIFSFKNFQSPTGSSPEMPSETFFEAQNAFSQVLIKKDSFTSRKIESLFKPLSKISLNEAFEIYRNNYAKSLLESLKDTFEATEKFLGEKRFKQLSLQFIMKNKATTPFLSDYGGEFPKYLEVQEHLKNIYFLKDLARFEWFIKESALKNETQVLKTKHPVYEIFLHLMNKVPINELRPLGDHHRFTINFNQELLVKSHNV